jgi:threonine/homoserine/homoserine lactone efflux protein
MPDLTTYLAFVTAVVAMQVTPGPDMMLVVGRGIGQGRRTALLAVFGMTVMAGTIQLPLLALGVATIVRGAPLLLDLLRWAGAAYLIWLGAKLLLTSGDVRHPAEASTHVPRRLAPLAAVREGMVNNLTNPKPMLFMLAFLPQSVSPESGSITMQLLALGATQKISGLLVQGKVALASGAVGEWLSGRPGRVAWQERFAGSVMVALGLHFISAGNGRGGRP